MPAHSNADEPNMTSLDASKDPLPRADGLTTSLADQARKRRKLMKGLAHEDIVRPPRRNDLKPQLVLEVRTIADLVPAARRVRKEDPIQIARIESSIASYGFCVPVLLTGSNEIVAGHLVVEAARRLGLLEVSCVIIDHLSPADIRRLRISLNRIAETGTWDFPELKLEAQELALELGEDFHIPGLAIDELDQILFEDVRDAATSSVIDRIPPVQQIAVSRLGDIWRLGPHLLGCGDAKNLDFIHNVLSGMVVRLCLTDPPFGVRIVGHVTRRAHREFVEGGGGTSREELYALFRDSFRVIDAVLIDGGLCMAFIDWRGLETMLQAGRETNFSLLNLVVWGKTNAGMGSLYRSHHELCPVFKKGSASHANNIQLGRKGRWRSNLWTYPGASSLGSDAREGLKIHPTVKPTAMLEDAILDVSNRGDVILDPFSGSGSTLIATHRTGRIFRGSELDPLYVDVILRRWIDLTGEQPVLDATGMSFNLIADQRLAEHLHRPAP